MSREQSNGRRSFLRKTVLLGASTGIIAAGTPVTASSSYNDNIKIKQMSTVKSRVRVKTMNPAVGAVPPLNLH